MVDIVLGDDGIALLRQTGAGEELLDVPQPAAGAVHPVVALTRSVSAADHLDFGEGYGQAAVAVVDDQPDLGHARRGAPGATGVDDLLHPRPPQLASAAFAQHPADGVDQVALAGAVGPHHGGDTGLEEELGLLGEGLEALHLDRLQMHVKKSMGTPLFPATQRSKTIPAIKTSHQAEVNIVGLPIRHATTSCSQASSPIPVRVASNLPMAALAAACSAARRVDPSPSPSRTPAIRTSTR